VRTRTFPIAVECKLLEIGARRDKKKPSHWRASFRKSCCGVRPSSCGLAHRISLRAYYAKFFAAKSQFTMFQYASTNFGRALR
jgi:hypothetical protein